jgi:hypothetical protein
MKTVKKEWGNILEKKKYRLRENENLGSKDRKEE